MIVGLICLGWIGLKLLIMDGMLAFSGCVLAVAGWLIFNSSKEQSPKPETTQTIEGEVKTGFARIRSFLKGLL